MRYRRNEIGDYSDKVVLIMLQSIIIYLTGIIYPPRDRFMATIYNNTQLLLSVLECGIVHRKHILKACERNNINTDIIMSCVCVLNFWSTFRLIVLYR